MPKNTITKVKTKNASAVALLSLAMIAEAGFLFILISSTSYYTANSNINNSSNARVTPSPTPSPSPSASPVCTGKCKSGPSEIDVKTQTLILGFGGMALELKGKINESLACTNPEDGAAADDEGLIQCKSENLGMADVCCRAIKININDLIFKSEGVDVCQGSWKGSTHSLEPGGIETVQYVEGETLDECAENALGTLANQINEKSCTGGDDCGYEVKAKGYIQIMQCPSVSENCRVDIYVDWEKQCKGVDVSGGCGLFGLPPGCEYQTSGKFDAQQKCNMMKLANPQAK
ncbi:MAG: hypothetical protein US74_C0052G0011 [Parcubacteria group bacterium GW2011_GWA2_38_13]|nr:MAG: hypothetical protein US74_C0052G0011 [Parcubacteria group bacterium GW2011_GWA2_38_13]